MKRVYVKWEDIYSYDPWIQSVDALKYMEKPCICESIGFLLSKDKNRVIICGSVNSENQVCGLLRIPCGCIKEFLPL